MEIEFPEKLLFLLDTPARYKVLYGGRGAGKTENIARALIILASQKRLRIACFRELQTSIAESVHETIKNQVNDMGLYEEFNILDKTITSKRTGSEFIFKGIRYNINSIKSLARIDIAWIEEAVNVSKGSWEKLGPTIRGRHEDDPNGMGGPFRKGPEIWISFNPELDTDETYKRFVLQRDKYAPDYREGERYAIVEKLNWTDNKWFPPDLKLEMELAKEKTPDEWLNVWEGHTKQTINGAIYAEEIKKVLLDGRRGKVSYDSARPVHTFWDLGHHDNTAIWFIQRVGVEYNIINYFQDNLKKIPYYLEHLQSLGYVYGTHHLPHDGENETLAGRSVAKQLRDVYPKQVKIVPRVSKKVMGIRAARLVFDLCNFDEENTADGWQCLCRYQYEVDEDGKWSREPAHNDYSHGCFTADTKVLTRDGLKAISTLPENGEVWTLLGWKKYQNVHLTRANAPLVEVSFSDGSMVKCTPDHLFLTAAKEWKSAESLTKGLLIQSGLVKQNNFLMIEFIEYINLQNILRVLKNYIAMFGNLHSVLYLKDVTFIIKMKLKQIINYGILNVFLGKNIYSLPGNYSLNVEKFQNLIMKPDKKQQVGIVQVKGENGIKNTQKISNLMKNGNEKHFIAKIVDGLFKRLIAKQDEENIVRLNVEMLCLKSVKRLNETADVYCLTVPECGHFALANGAIVKNCDAFQTFALSLKSETEVKKPKVVYSSTHFKPSSHNGWMGS